MKLLPEFQKIVDEAKELNWHQPEIAIFVAQRCQSLALRVPEMSDEDIEAIYRKNYPEAATNVAQFCLVHAVLAAYEAKRWASPDEPFDFDKWKQGGRQAYEHGMPVDRIGPDANMMRRKV